MLLFYNQKWFAHVMSKMVDIFVLFVGAIDSPNEPEPMLLFPKRTFQPSTIRRKRNHGFFARYVLVLNSQLHKVTHLL